MQKLRKGSSYGGELEKLPLRKPKIGRDHESADAFDANTKRLRGHLPLTGYTAGITKNIIDKHKLICYRD